MQYSFSSFSFMWTYGLIICDTINLVKVSHINKSCILGLETYLVENYRSPSYPFLGQWFMVGATIPISLFCFSFLMTKTIYAVRKH